jgi:hypothetical protein
VNQGLVTRICGETRHFLISIKNPAPGPSENAQGACILAAIAQAY